ncbi:hypothetical protein BS47DRAFT_1384303 [Hydnum rufescens UP504]|uniref:Uncharacterized protein n=1 Tax=Hydnum rufescens UP504 TaxID=1448309 RepID=A0A9P6APR4_9AGAM|nr:hypothetical protein BS47DRAFT_1384303 [Hydnum rufescens UP504]
MMVSAGPFVFFLAIISIVAASPIDRRDVPTSICTTIASGTLRTTNGHNVHFVDDTLTFGSAPLAVEFQSCQPNFGRYDGQDGRPIGGHIYVPSTKKCLTIASGAPIPFTVSQQPCETVDDSRQTFSNFIKQSDDKIYYVGNTQVDGSTIFHGDVCPSGYFGPVSSATSGTAALHCVNDPHVVGFNI